MKELSYASFLSQTANGAVDLIVATIPEDVMHAFEIEETESTPLTVPKDEAAEAEEASDAAPVAPSWWTSRLHEICPHRLTHPRANLLAVAGLLVTGALVVYMTALHMGYVSSEEAALLSTFDQTLPYSNVQSAPPPTYVNDPSFSANTSAGNQPALGNYTSGNVTVAEESSPVANVSSSPVAINGTSPPPPSPPPSPPPTAPAPPPPPEPSLPPPSPPPEPSSPPPPAETTDAGIYYQSMSETWHTMSDRELLRKASSMPPLQAPHEGRVAYMFMTRGSLPFAPLWERYFRGHEQLYSIYIHAPPDYVPTLAPSSPFFGRFIPSKVVRWGRLSVYQAERRLLGNALLDDRNEWFLLLSESCIPIFNFPNTYAYLNESQGVSFIESYRDGSRKGQGRLFRGQFEEMEPEITGENFRKGSQWFQMNRDLALLVAADSVEYTKFEKYFCKIHPVCYIDEHFLPTFAWIKRPQAISFRTLTYYVFRGKSPHPNKFGKGETDAKLILRFRGAGGHTCTYNGQTTSKCYLFVRKFDPSALDSLLDLAGPVMEIP